MVRDGIFYGVGLFAVAAVIAYFASPWWASPPLLLAAFILWFFRDPSRTIPSEPGAVVSPADGKVTHITPCQLEGHPATRVSIFLNVFDVHVNRSPIAGTIKDVQYHKGKFLNAMAAECAEQNEQNRITVVGGIGETIVFTQIAGLIARRIVFTKSAGESVARGERVGMIKFGSRTDVVLPSSARLVVNVGDRVKGGASLLARFPQPGQHSESAAAELQTV